jgi:hypothetical protein
MKKSIKKLELKKDALIVFEKSNITGGKHNWTTGGATCWTCQPEIRWL